ncbi:MAG: hypothetical protein HYV95_09295 [Opitutae bacterium]|nr:hypothetical protein [Opitutae bacterium]
MSTSEKLHGLLAQLQRPGGTQTADLARLLEQLLQLLDTLPPGPHALDALKKPGAWKSVPLKTTTPEVPLWVKLPCAIDFENITPEQLKGLQAVPAGFNSTVSVGVGS